MAISVVQRAKGQDVGGATGSAAAAFGSNVTNGNYLIAIGIGGSVNATSLATPTDTRGFTFTLLFNNAQASGIKVWGAPITATGAETVTMSDGFAGATAMHCYEVSGLGAAPNFDKSHQTNSVNTATPTSGNTPTLTNANELVLGIFTSDATTGFNFTAGSGFSNIQTQNQNFASFATEEQIVAATTALAATANGNTNGNTWSVVVTFSDTTISAAGIVAKQLIRSQAVKRASYY